MHFHSKSDHRTARQVAVCTTSWWKERVQKLDGSVEASDYRGVSHQIIQIHPNTVFLCPIPIGSIDSFGCVLSAYRESHGVFWSCEHVALACWCSIRTMFIKIYLSCHYVLCESFAFEFVFVFRVEDRFTTYGVQRDIQNYDICKLACHVIPLSLIFFIRVVYCIERRSSQIEYNRIL